MYRLTDVELVLAIFFLKSAKIFSQKRGIYDFNSFQIDYVNQ